MQTVSIAPLALALCALVACGCSASASSASRGDTKAAAAPQASNLSPEQCLNGAVIQASNDQQGYHIQPGDQLGITFYLNPEFNDEVPVSPDGQDNPALDWNHRGCGDDAVGTRGQIDKDYLSELRSPDAAVIVKNMPGRQVYVQGQVNRPGAFPLEPGMTALQALADAGGLTPEAADDDVVLIRRDACGRPTRRTA